MEQLGDYTISVEQVREHFRSKGLTKSKDTVQRWCRTGDLDCRKLGLLSRYFTTETSLLMLERKLLPDLIAENAGQVRSGAANVQPQADADEANINFDAKVIRVSQRADEYCQIGAPKSRAGVRSIPMAPTVFTVLSDWKDHAPLSSLDLAFPNSVGKVQNYSNIYNRVFKPMLVDNGIVDASGQSKFGIHALRHAAASLFIEQGWNPKKIQTLLGHASINMTMGVYGPLFENAEEDVSMFEDLESNLMAA